eukprot:1177943-Prorocentrum_minimum.AAC.4
MPLLPLASLALTPGICPAAELAPVDPEQTCMRAERSGHVSPASGRNMWILNHCKAQARLGSSVPRQLAPLTRQRHIRSLVDLDILHVLYVPYHIEQVLCSFPFCPPCRA